MSQPKNPKKHISKTERKQNKQAFLKILPITKEEPLPAPVEESSFATLFPKYREEYIRDNWDSIKQILEPHGIKSELDLVQGSMSVFTTKKTWDPWAILNSRDFIKMVARSVPIYKAKSIFKDGIFCDIIKIGGFVRNKERFAKRRQRLLGPNGTSLKALELLTDCYIMVQGNTVSVIGEIKGLKAIRRVVEDCMKNIHPIYSIKLLMIKKELESNKAISQKDWSRFLPNFRKQKFKRKAKKAKKPYTPFPPEQTRRKVDIQLETGEYFMGADSLRVREKEKMARKRKEKRRRKREEAMLEYETPEEDVVEDE